MQRIEVVAGEQMRRHDPAEVKSGFNTLPVQPGYSVSLVPDNMSPPVCFENGNGLRRMVGRLLSLLTMKLSVLVKLKRFIKRLNSLSRYRGVKQWKL